MKIGMISGTDIDDLSFFEHINKTNTKTPYGEPNFEIKSKIRY